MSLEDQRVEVPFDERDQLVETARWFSEAPDDMSAWRALVDAVETARPIHTDPLDSAVRTIANLREDKADPQDYRPGVPGSGRTPPGCKAPGGREPRQPESARCRVADRRLAPVGPGRVARRRRRTREEPAGAEAGGRHSRQLNPTGSAASPLQRVPGDASCGSTAPPTS